MASLTGQSINTTYEGLIKTDLNTALPTGFTSATITDGAGNATGLKLGQNYIGIEPTSGHLYDVASQNGFSFDGTQLTASGSWDFSTATITGIDTGVTSIIAGTNISVDQSTGDVTISASGGGSTEVTTYGGLIDSSIGIWKAPMLYATNSNTAQSLSANTIFFVPFQEEEGATLDEITFKINSTQQIKVGIYNAVKTSDSAYSGTYLFPSTPVELADFTPSAAGVQELTGLSYTLPSTVENTYYFAFQQSAFGAVLNYVNNQRTTQKAFTWNNLGTGAAPYIPGSYTLGASSYGFVSSPRHADGFRLAANPYIYGWRTA